MEQEVNPEFFPGIVKDKSIVTCDGRFLYQLVRGNTIVMMNHTYIVTENPTFNSFPIKRWTVWRYLLQTLLPSSPSHTIHPLNSPTHFYRVGLDVLHTYPI